MKFKCLTLFFTFLIFFQVVSACGAGGPSKKMVFLGDSMIKRGDWSTYFGNHDIVNLGIGGNRTDNVLNRLDQVVAQNPMKIFLMVGINDLLQQKDPKNTINNYNKILTTLTHKLPNTRIYLMSVLPLNQEKSQQYKKRKYLVSLNQVNQLNDPIKRLSKTNSHLMFINLYPGLVQNGQLISFYSTDGLHLNQNGYKVWAKEIKRFVN